LRRIKRERRAWDSRLPELTSLSDKLCAFSRAGRALPLLFIEFSHIGPRAQRSAAGFERACKQAIAATLKAAVGTQLRKHDLVASGAGGHWFIVLLTGSSARRTQTADADIGAAAERLRRTVQQAVSRPDGDRARAATRVGVRCGWNVLEPVDVHRPLEALRHAIRGAALVGRVEARRAIMLAAVTHELRTPLTAIIGFAERLCDPEATNARQRLRYASIIGAEGRRLQRLSEGLIDAGAWTAGGLQLHLQRRDLRPIADAAVTAVKDRAEKRSLKIIVEGNASAQVDRDRLLQILTNLLDNALRHSPEGASIKLRLGARRDGCFISVTDQGRGFSLRARRALGMPFGATADGGTGLGLAISNILVEAHGGALALGGRGGGGRVTVSLPVRAITKPS
jgi:signal transduction histidine kinase